MNRLQFLYLLCLACNGVWTWYFVEHAREWGLTGPWPLDVLAGGFTGFCATGIIFWLVNGYIKLGEK